MMHDRVSAYSKKILHNTVESNFNFIIIGIEW